MNVFGCPSSRPLSSGRWAAGQLDSPSDHTSAPTAASAFSASLSLPAPP